MDIKTTLKRYELFGWDYEYRNPLTKKEVAWYREFASETDGPILELACGTGRLLVSLAREGYEIEGIDLSPAMLRIARRKISELPPDVRRRVRLHLADMANFHLKRKFGLALIANNSFQELKLPEQRVGCLSSVYNHLIPGGRLLVTVRRFDPKRWVNGRRDTPWSEPLPHPITGELVRRMVRFQVDRSKEWVHGVMVYKLFKTDGREVVEEFPIEFPMLSGDDYIHLFSAVGFSTTSFGGYEERPPNESDQYLCFVGEKIDS